MSGPPGAPASSSAPLAKSVERLVLASFEVNSGREPSHANTPASDTIRRHASPPVSATVERPMSVTSLLRFPGVRDILKPLLPEGPVRLGMTLRASPLTVRNHGGVGIAFDYVLRFELERLYAHARSMPWIAEALGNPTDLVGDEPLMAASASVAAVGTRAAMARRWAKIVAAARDAHAAYKAMATPTALDREQIARHALRLARVDVSYRSPYIDPEPERADEADVRDVVQLLDLAPCAELGHASLLWLNPTFGIQSLRVGGADADIISGDRLIDIKTTKKPAPKEDLLQLVSYLLLATAERRRLAAFPDVRQIGVYYARHGYLWLVPVDQFLSNPAFERVSQSYFEIADRVFGGRRRMLARAAAQAVEPSVPGANLPMSTSEVESTDLVLVGAPRTPSGGESKAKTSEVGSNAGKSRAGKPKLRSTANPKLRSAAKPELRSARKFRAMKPKLRSAAKPKPRSAAKSRAGKSRAGKPKSHSARKSKVETSKAAKSTTSQAGKSSAGKSTRKKTKGGSRRRSKAR